MHGNRKMHDVILVDRVFRVQITVTSKVTGCLDCEALKIVPPRSQHDLEIATPAFPTSSHT